MSVSSACGSGPSLIWICSHSPDSDCKASPRIATALRSGRCAKHQSRLPLGRPSRRPRRATLGSGRASTPSRGSGRGGPCARCYACSPEQSERAAPERRGGRPSRRAKWRVRDPRRSPSLMVNAERPECRAPAAHKATGRASPGNGVRQILMSGTSDRLVARRKRGPPSKSEPRAAANFAVILGAAPLKRGSQGIPKRPHKVYVRTKSLVPMLVMVLVLVVVPMEP